MKIASFGYDDTTVPNTKIVLFWLVIFNLKIVHIGLLINFHLLPVTQLSF